jgi:hypothetical protein
VPDDLTDQFVVPYVDTSDLSLNSYRAVLLAVRETSVEKTAMPYGTAAIATSPLYHHVPAVVTEETGCYLSGVVLLGGFLDPPFEGAGAAGAPDPPLPPLSRLTLGVVILEKLPTPGCGV